MNSSDPGSTIRLDRIIERILALILLLAAALKSRQILNNYHVIILGLHDAKLLMAGLIQAEVILGLWLIVGGLPRARLVVGLVCFCLFALAAIYEASHAMPSCGCFGNVKVSPGITAGFDVVAVMALWFTRQSRRVEQNHRVSQKLAYPALILAIAVSALLWNAIALSKPSSLSNATSRPASEVGLVVLQPETWVNEPFSLFNEIDGSEPLRAGRWLLVFYHFDCDSCLQAIPHYMSWVSNSGNNATTRPQLAFVAVPPFAPRGQNPVRESPAYLRLVLRSDHDWYATTPLVVAIQDGRVLVAEDGDKAIEPPAVAGWGE